MAVIPDLLGLEITVCVDGTPLTEYEDDEPRGQALSVAREGIPAGKSISKYIESETDREFAIGLTISSPFKLDCPSLGFSLLIDGVRVAKTIFRGSHHGLDKPWSCFMDGIRVGPARTLMPLKFSKIETSLGDTRLDQVKEDEKRIANIGEITVQVFRKSESRRSWATSRKEVSLEADYLSKVHEKALKGESKSHAISLGEGRADAAQLNKYKSDYLDGKDCPIATYTFKYRSEEALKQLLIIPCTPEPESPPRSRRANTSTVILDLDPIEMEEVQRPLAEMKASRHVLRSLAPQMKQEIEHFREEDIPNKKAKKMPLKAMIDLTGDSD